MVRKFRLAAVVVTAVATLFAGAPQWVRGPGLPTAGPGDHWCC